MGRSYEGAGNRWDCHEVGFLELPTVQELLQQCDVFMLMEVLENDYAWERGYYLVDDLGLGQFLYGAITDMCQLDVVRTGEEGEWVVLPAEAFSFQDGKYHLVRTIKAVRSLLRMTDDSRFQWGARLMGSCERLTWEEALSYRVWAGGFLCMRERYMLLASVVWELVRDEALQRFFEGPFEAYACGWIEDAPKSDPWGLELKGDFNECYERSMRELVDLLNEQAWARFQMERAYFADFVLRYE